MFKKSPCFRETPRFRSGRQEEGRPLTVARGDKKRGRSGRQKGKVFGATKKGARGYKNRAFGETKRMLGLTNGVRDYKMG